MKITISNPTCAFIDSTDEELVRLRKELTFTNTSIVHDIKRLYNNHWARNKDKEKWMANIETLKRKAKRILVFGENQPHIYPGSIPYLTGFNLEIDNKIVYPTPKKVAWKKPLPFELYPYQEESWGKLLEVKHGNVELCTGSGKSAILLKLCRETGFRTAIVAPSKSIFNELLEKFEYHFGKGMVGTFGAGKKKLDKKFTICIGDSLVNIVRDTEEWKFFSNLDMLLADESHTFGAETLEEMCFGVLAAIPYRFFFSGTQTRGDGAEKLLQAIIGQTVHTLTTQQAVEGGYICPHEYRIVNVESSNPNYYTQDALDMKRKHFLKNRNICAFIAKFANAQSDRGLQTLILVEELEQIAMLLPLLRAPTVIAHSEKKAERLSELGLSKVDPAESVEKFNKAQALNLIGTSCIATGTNIFANHFTFNWVGGSSEIKTLQGTVGRSVRLYKHNPWKDKCIPKEKCVIFDFNVYDVDIMVRHLENRIAYYNRSGSEIKHIKLTK